jgi:hypothetical protein
MPHSGGSEEMFKHAGGHDPKAVGDLTDTPRYQTAGKGEVRLRKRSVVSRTPLSLPRKTPRSRG